MIPNLPPNAYETMECRFDGSKHFIPFSAYAVKYSRLDPSDVKQAPVGVQLYCVLCWRAVQLKEGRFETVDPASSRPPIGLS